MLDRMLKIEIEDRHPIAVVRLTGFMAQLEVYKLKNQMELLFGAAKRFLVLDLREVSFMDSAGIGTLVQLRQEALKAGGQLALIKPQVPSVRQSLEVAALQQVIDFFDDPLAAIDFLRKKHGLSGGSAPENNDLDAKVDTLIEQVMHGDERLRGIEEHLERIEQLLLELRKKAS